MISSFGPPIILGKREEHNKIGIFYISYSTIITPSEITMSNDDDKGLGREEQRRQMQVKKKEGKTTDMTRIGYNKGFREWISK